MGLEYLDRDVKGKWVEIPTCGHGTATVLVGSVLERITCGHFKAARHRVRRNDSEDGGGRGEALRSEGYNIHVISYE